MRASAAQASERPGNRRGGERAHSRIYPPSYRPEKESQPMYETLRIPLASLFAVLAAGSASGRTKDIQTRSAQWRGRRRSPQLTKHIEILRSLPQPRDDGDTHPLVTRDGPDSGAKFGLWALSRQVVFDDVVHSRTGRSLNESADPVLLSRAVKEDRLNVTDRWRCGPAEGVLTQGPRRVDLYRGRLPSAGRNTR